MTRTTAVVLLLLASVALVPTATAAPDQTFAVGLQADGDARITVTTTFDLETDDRRRAFRALAANESARRAYSARFAERLSAVASATAERTGRNMTVRNVSLSLARDEGVSVGRARVAATWTDLAATRDGDLIVTEPFASGFSLDDGRIAVGAPDGYEVASVTPEPDRRDGDRLVWAAGTDLSGFELTAAQSGGGSGSGSSTGTGPGVGAAGALAALVVASLAAARRRS